MAKQLWPAGIRPHGNGIQIRLSKNGKYIYSETLAGNPHSARDLASAVKRRDELKARLKLGLALDTEERSVSRLFTEAAQAYMDTLDADYSTHITYERIINRYWLPAFHKYLVTDITTEMIKRILTKVPVSQKTKKNILIPLRGILANEEVNPNPAAAVRLKKHQRPVVERFTPKERDKILAELEGQALVYFTLLFGTGLRPSEALGLTWSDYHDGWLNIDKAIVVRRAKDTTKTHTSRKVYVPQWVRPVLLAHWTRFEGGHIFVNTRGSHFKDTDIFNEAWQDVLKRKRIRYRVPYVCRHTRAAELLSSGVVPGEAAKQLGHTLEMFFRTYAEWIDEFSSDRDLDKLEGMQTDHGPKMGQEKRLRD